VGGRARRLPRREVPFSFAFATLLLTGYAPLLAFTPLYGAAAPVSLVAATLLLRWRAAPAGAEPLKLLGAVPRRYRRAVVSALAVAGPLMFAYVVAYGATHPLRWGYSSHDRVHAYQPGKLMRYELALENGAPGAVSDISIVRVEGSPALQLERVGLEPYGGECVVPEGRRTCDVPLRPLGDYRFDEDGGRPITLELRQGRVCPSGIARLDAVWVRYTVLGTRQEQRIPLQESPGVRCP
jgi:hypothetical protein